MVVFDATFLVALLDKQVVGEEIDARVELLLETLNGQSETIIIPTPALSEVLVGAKDAAPKYLEIIEKSRCFRIAPFGERAAVEAAALIREAKSTGDKRGGLKGEWSKIKFDWQIVAISKVEGASTIYSDDADIIRLTKGLEIDVVKLEDLPHPPKKPQGELDLE